MDPFSREYLHTLESIREELTRFKSEQNSLRFQISNIFEENKKLTSELKENVEIRFRLLSESDAGQLEQKLQAAVASKNAAVEMWQAALQQMEKQEESLVGTKSSERSEVEKRLLQMKEEYTKGANVLSEELSSSRGEISRLKEELSARTSQLEASKSSALSIGKKLEISQKTANDLSVKNDELQERIDSLQSSLSDSDKALEMCKEKISAVTNRNAELSASVAKLEEQNKKLKSEILMYEKDAKESLLAAEEAVLQRQEIICKEEQYQNEIKMLKSSIDVEKDKVSLRFKSEIKDVQKKAGEKLQNLMSEIQQLHKELGEKQNMFERANREKQALESKIELLYSENSNGMPMSNFAFDDMCKRLTMAEKARDELELKLSSLETTLQETKSSKEQEIQYLLEKQRSFNERFQNFSKDFNQASSDRIKLSDEVTKLRKRSSDLEKELANVKAKCKKDISVLETESRQTVRNLQEQLRGTEEHYKNVCSELQKLLDAEFRISNKWKSEVEDLISKSEVVIKELSREAFQLKNSNTDLINILHQNNIRVPNEILINLS